MSNRNPSEGRRVVKALPAVYTKTVEVAIGVVLEGLPAGAKKLFAIRMGKSQTWVTRLIDPNDHIRLASSDIGKALNALGTPDPLNAELEGVKIGGAEHRVMPKPRRVKGGDIERASLRLQGSLGGYTSELVEALVDGQLSQAERASLRRVLGEHQRAVTDILLSLEGE